MVRVLLPTSGKLFNILQYLCFNKAEAPNVKRLKNNEDTVEDFKQNKRLCWNVVENVDLSFVVCYFPETMNQLEFLRRRRKRPRDLGSG